MGTRPSTEAEALIETALLVVDDLVGISAALGGKYLRHAGLVCRVICATGVADLKDKLSWVTLRST